MRDLAIDKSLNSNFILMKEEANIQWKYFLLFAGKKYYPEGGWNEFIGNFSSIEEAKKGLVKESNSDEYLWSHIVDLLTSEIVLIGNNEFMSSDYREIWKWYKPEKKG